MGYVTARRITPNDRIEKCDSCEQQGVYANGKEIKDSVNEVVMWFCYNCVQDTLRDRGK
jgi:hypothetical protein